MSRIIFLFCFMFMSLNPPAQNPWDEITKEAVELEKEEKWEEALLLRERATNLAVTADTDTKQYLKACENVTRAEVILGTSADYQQAYDLMLSGVQDLIAAKAEPLEISKVYRRLGMISYNHLHKRKESYAHTLNSVEYHEQSAEKDSAILARTYHSLSVTSRQLGRLDESLGHFNKLMSLYREQDTVSKGITYRDLGVLYGSQFLDMFSKSMAYLEMSKDLLESAQETNPQYLMSVYMELGNLATTMGDYSGAEGYLNKGIRYYRDNKEAVQRFRKAEVRNYPEIQYNMYLISVYVASGNEEKVLRALANIEAIEKNEQLRGFEYDMYAMSLKYTGNLYREEQPDKALYYYEKALYIHQNKDRDYNYAAEINVSIAHAYFQKADYAKALSSLQSAEKDPDITKRDRKGIYYLRAKTFFSLDKTDTAIEEIQRLIAEVSPEKFDIRTGNAQDYVPGLGNDAKYYLSIARNMGSAGADLKSIKEKLLWMALMEFESNIGSTPLNKDLKKDFDLITSGLMDIALELGFSTTENTRLLTFMETVTAQDMVNDFLLKREIAGNTEFYQLVEEEQYIRSYITYLKKELQQNKDEDLVQQLFEKELELKEVNGRLASQYRQGQLFAVPDMGAMSGKNIIKFQVADSALFKTRLYNGNLTYQKIEDYPALKQQIENYLNQINNLETPVSTIKEQGAALYHKLFKDDFDHDEATVIIPDGILHYLPFELLVKADAYLIENHTISYASNFYFLNAKAPTKQTSKNKRVAFFAPEYTGTPPESRLAVRGVPYSLAGAAAEVQGIAAFIQGDVYLGNEASKTRFRSLEGNVSVLHLAMHSNLNDEDPELSNLLFSSSESDYEMYISELYGMNFNSDLAVLSACNTGVGGFQDGGNLVSMRSAFTMAGIPATVASLWNAPDESTKEIMIALYKNLKQGDDKATALQKAKLGYLNSTQDENLQHPFYWAGFVLSGDESPIQLGSAPFWKKPMVIFPLLSVCILAAIGIFAVRRRNKPI